MAQADRLIEDNWLLVLYHLHLKPAELEEFTLPQLRALCDQAEQLNKEGGG